MSKELKQILAERGWHEYHLFMRGNKYVKGNDILIYDEKGFTLNGELISQAELIKLLTK